MNQRDAGPPERRGGEIRADGEGDEALDAFELAFDDDDRTT